MKAIFTSIVSLGLAMTMSANNVELVVEKVDNHGVVAASTYRVYAVMPSASHSVHAVWGDAQTPLKIETTTSFYQHELGAHNSSAIHPNVIALVPALAYDSFITLGYADATLNSVWDIGVGFAGFNAGGAIETNDGSWFLLPEDDKCKGNAQGLVLLAQLTTDGVATGTISLQGWDGNKQSWQERGLTFSTNNAKTFGCTDATAMNYAPQANYNDGTCQYKSADATLEAVAEMVAVETWNVFPNPMLGQLIHIQFSAAVDASKGSVEILDMSGKRVAMHELSKGNWSAPNRVTIEQTLSAGSYQILLTRDGKTESKTLVVSK